MSLVVKHFYANSEPNSEGNYAEIFARQSGLINWIFSLFTIDPTYKLKISYDNFIYEASTFIGFKKVSIPTGSICSAYYGIHKPYIKAIILFLIFCSIGYAYYDLATFNYNKLVVSVDIGLIGFCIAMLYYIFNKQLVINISDLNGNNFPLLLKRSFIEGKAITQDDLALVVSIISAILRENRNLGNINNPNRINSLKIISSNNSLKYENTKVFIFLVLFFIFVGFLSLQNSARLSKPSLNIPRIHMYNPPTANEGDDFIQPNTNFAFVFKSNNWVRRQDGETIRNINEKSKPGTESYLIVTNGVWRKVQEGDTTYYYSRVKDKTYPIVFKDGRWQYQ